MYKKKSRLRRAKKTRINIKKLGVNCLSVHRTAKNIYCQLIDPQGKVLAAASTLNGVIREKVSYAGNVAAAKVVGKDIADKAIKLGIKKVAYDRSGFKYHGRVKALADAARESGLEF